MTETLIMGAVAYDPKVVTIWEGFRAWLRAAGLGFDFILYSHYERQVDELVAGRIHAAWNSPLAWIRARRLAEAHGRSVRAAVMRDTDQDLTSVIIVRAESDLQGPEDLRGRCMAVGALDSPQATLIPLADLRKRGIVTDLIDIVRFNVGVGLHGDHIGGERDAARALLAGKVDAACMIDANHLLFGQEGTLPAGATRVIAQTPLFDHCNMTLIDSAPVAAAQQFEELLLSMSYGDSQVRSLMDLEGLRSWCAGRASGYAQLEAAVRDTAFYDDQGRITAVGYPPRESARSGRPQL